MGAFCLLVFLSSPSLQNPTTRFHLSFHKSLWSKSFISRELDLGVQGPGLKHVYTQFLPFLAWRYSLRSFDFISSFEGSVSHVVLLYMLFTCSRLLSFLFVIHRSTSSPVAFCPAAFLLIQSICFFLPLVCVYVFELVFTFMTCLALDHHC